MGFRIILIGLVVWLVSSCAQVGTLSGGDEDFYAPSPVEVSPAPNTINFTQNQVSIRFDEFVELSNPQQNIFLVPSDAKPKAKLVNKTLHINWDEALKSNTTYTLYINGAVKDITEGNDSLMTYVFSTGDHIDSLSYETQVKDAWTNEPIKNVLVGLYPSEDSLKPLYFSRSDFNGFVKMNNLREGQYSVKAFSDDDKDLKINKTEARGFKSGLLNLDSSLVDTSVIRIYTPIEEIPSVNSHRFVGPGQFLIETNKVVPGDLNILLNGTVIPENEITYLNNMIYFFSKVDTLSNARVILNGSIKDTLSFFLSKKDKSSTCTLLASSSVIHPLSSIEILLNDKIVSLDTSLISVQNNLDSSLIQPVSFLVHANRINVDFARNGVKNVIVNFEKGAIKSLNQNEHPSYRIPLEIKPEKDYGTLVVSGWESSVPLVVQIQMGMNAPYTATLNGSAPVKFKEFLSPGEYSVRVIEDINSNSQWDPGDFNLTTQPERVYDFSNVKIRANWEVELTLDPEKNE